MTLAALVDAAIAYSREHQAWVPALVFVLGLLESLAFLSILVPSSVILLSIASLFGAAGLRFEPLVIAGGLGASLGYAISYWLGLYFQGDILKLWPFSRHPAMVERAERFFRRFGVLSVFLGHFFGPVRAVIPVLAGSAKMGALPFQIANVPSGFLWAGLVMAPGYFATSSSALTPFWNTLRSWAGG
jgi:membrane protein DedA with SNARE-associated domain